MSEKIAEISVTYKARKPWLAFLLSFLAPGLGQLYNGQPRKTFICVFYFIPVVFLYIPLSRIGFLGLSLIIILHSCIRLLLIPIEAIVSAIKKKQYVLHDYNKWYFYLMLIIIIPISQYYMQYYLMKYSLLPFVHPFQTATGSMQPTIQVGEKIMADMTCDTLAELRRGDVIAFKHDADVTYLKRLIAFPGEIVLIKDKTVYINNEPLEEPWQLEYASDPNKTLPSNVTAKFAIDEDYIIPENHVFLLGDNRDYSLDSRRWGAIEANKIRGKVLYIFWSKDKSRIGKKIE
jgi:signal peptidase I